MGASNYEITYPHYSKEILKKEVSKDRDSMISEYGEDPYSGTWGAKDGGLDFNTNTTYNSFNEAFDKICSYSKWDSIVAVPYIDLSKTKSSNEKSNEMIARKKEELQTLRNEKGSLLKTYLTERQSKRKTVTCWKCSEKTKADEVTVSKRCPHCNAESFYLSLTEHKRIDLLKMKIRKLEADIKKREQTIVKSNQKLVAAVDTKISKISNEIYKLENMSKSTTKTSGFVTCSHCKSKINLSQSHDKETCPVCQVGDLQNKKISNNSSKIWTLTRTLKDLYSEKSKLTGIYWLVGGICPS